MQTKEKRESEVLQDYVKSVLPTFEIGEDGIRSLESRGCLLLNHLSTSNYSNFKTGPLLVLYGRTVRTYCMYCSKMNGI